MKRILVVAAVLLALTLSTTSSITAESGRAEAAVTTVVPTVVTPGADSGWSAPQCTYLYICVQARIICAPVYFDLACFGYSRTYFAPAGWSISANAQLFIGGYPPTPIGTHTTNCGTYRDAPQYGVCQTQVSSPIGGNMTYVVRATAWKNQDPRPRPIAYASVWMPN